MAAFKGYFDESGKENDPQFANSAVAAAGYVTTAESWLEVETKWKAVLALPEFGVPYLHMKEFAHSEPRSPFESWKGDESRRSAFIAALGDVIRQSDLFGVGAVIRLPDLQRFNRKYNVKLQAYPLSVYACLIELSIKYSGNTVETIWDKIDKHARDIATARGYADSDAYYQNCGREIQILPLEGSLSSKSVPALQIADLAAYELLKSHRDKNDWHMNEAPFIKPEERFKSLFEWISRKAIKSGKKEMTWPNERKSFLALFGGVEPRPMEGIIWTYETLVRTHTLRNGVWS